MKAEIYPLEKVIVNGITLCLGMTRSEVEALLGAGQEIGNRCYYFNGEAAIDYKEGKVEFIEFLGGADGICKPEIYGVSAFDIHAEELIERLKKRNDGEFSDVENGHCCIFSKIGVGAYREAVPKEIEEMIEEAAAFGTPMSPDEIEYESKRADYFATIGVGIAGYYAKKIE